MTTAFAGDQLLQSVQKQQQQHTHYPLLNLVLDGHWTAPKIVLKRRPFWNSVSLILIFLNYHLPSVDPRRIFFGWRIAFLICFSPSLCLHDMLPLCWCYWCPCKGAHRNFAPLLQIFSAHSVRVWEALFFFPLLQHQLLILILKQLLAWQVYKYLMASQAITKVATNCSLSLSSHFILVFR